MIITKQVEFRFNHWCLDQFVFYQFDSSATVPKKKYDTWLTPFEKLKSLEAVDKLLKPGALIADLEQMEQKYDDVTFAELKEKKHKKLFKNLS